MRKDFTCLQEVRLAYEQGKISLLKATRAASKLIDELNTIYPSDLAAREKIYLFLNDLDESVAWCGDSPRPRTFISVSAGYRQFCGNLDTCQCNAKAYRQRLDNRDSDTQAKINDKRRSTVRSKYGVNSVSQVPRFQDQAARTCLARYGTKSPTQNSEVLKKSRQTCLENHGVEYPQQNSYILAKSTSSYLVRYGVFRPAQSAQVQDQIRKTVLDRYGVTSVMRDPSIVALVTYRSRKTKHASMFSDLVDVLPLFTKEDYAQGRSDSLYQWQCLRCGNQFLRVVNGINDRSCEVCHPPHHSAGELKIRDWLDQAGVDYEMGSFSVISPQQLDFYLPSLNLAIEFNGTYWHSELRGRGRTYHVNKFKACREKGIRLLQIFEHELKHKEALIRGRVMNALGKSDRKIHARKCLIVEVEWSVAQSFYDTNHLQGSLRSKKNYALVQGHEIVSMMSFSRPRFSKALADWELTRFASKLGVSVPGAASKLFSGFVRRENPSSVVSYADLRWGEGKTYEILGFQIHHHSQPNYWYFKNSDDIRSRVQFQKHKLPQDLHDLGSEWQIMQHLGWNRFWDCGNAVWLWTR